MAEEKKHEEHHEHGEEHHEHSGEHHEHHESKTVTLKKSTLWGILVVVLVALLVVSIVTGGFGLSKGSSYAANTGANNAAGTASNSNSAAAGTTIDPSLFTSNPSLFPSLGPSNAKYTVIEIADFQCPYCALASGLPNWTSQYASQYGSLIGSAGSMEKLAQQGKIQFIFVPLSFLDNPSDANGPESTQAAEAAFCAYDQNPSLFWKMHDAIYTASTGPTEDDGKYSIPNLEKMAAGISGINTAQFNSCLQNQTDLGRVQQVMTDVQKAGIQIATPQFFVNGQQVQASTSSLLAAVGQ